MRRHPPVAALLVAVLLISQTAGCIARLPTRGEVAASQDDFPELDEARIGRARQSLQEYSAMRTVLLVSGTNWSFVRRADGTVTFQTPGDAASAGVIISRDGYLLTSAHGVRSGRVLAVLPPWDDPSQTPRLRLARVVWTGELADPPVDAALLKLELKPSDAPLRHVPLKALEGGPPAKGTPLLMTGVTPEVAGVGESPGRGNAAGEVNRLMRLPGVGYLVAVDAPVRPGFSGGPAISPKGHLAGVTVQLSVRMRPSILLPLPFLHFSPQFVTVLVRPDAEFVLQLIDADRRRNASSPRALRPASGIVVARRFDGS